MGPIVSFVVPCYNYGSYVTAAVDSVLAQTYDAIEIIVIDDASTDETPETLRRYADEPRVRIIRHAENRGHVASYNEGLRLTSGVFVGILSADDVALEQEAVAKQVELFESNPSVGLVYSAFRLISADGTPGALHRVSDRGYVTSGLEEFRRLILGDHIPASGTLVRRACHEQVGWYEEQLPHACDWDLWMRITTRYDAACIAEALYGYRVHAANMSHQRTADPGAAIDELLLALDRNSSLLPESARTALGPELELARRRALFIALWSDLANGRTMRAWQGLAAVVKRAPRALAWRKFYGSLARLLLLSAVGGRYYRRVVAAVDAADPHWPGSA